MLISASKSFSEHDCTRTQSESCCDGALTDSDSVSSPEGRGAPRVVLQDQEIDATTSQRAQSAQSHFPRAAYISLRLWDRGAVVLKELRRRMRQVKFVLVNDRTPRSQSFCAFCCEPIGGNYLRETATRLTYCDHKCDVGRQKLDAPVLTKIVRGRHHVVQTQSVLSPC